MTRTLTLLVVDEDSVIAAVPARTLRRPGYLRTSARRVVLLLALLGLQACARRSCASDKSPADPPALSVQVDGLENVEHKPLVVLYERDPWLTVIGSDVPTVILYEDATMIYVRSADGAVEHKRARLTQAELAEVTGAVINDDVWQSPATTTVDQGTDQPTVQLFLRRHDRWKVLSVYGLKRDGEPSGEDVESTPPLAAFVAAYRYLLALDPPDATRWRPDQIEMMLWDFEYARSAVPWPANIPAPGASVTPPDSGVYKHFVDGSHAEAVGDLLRSIQGTTAVRLNGRKWAMGARPRIPGEDYVHRVHACAHWINRPPGAPHEADTPDGCR